MKQIITLCLSLLVFMGFSPGLLAQGLPAQALTNVTIHNADGSTIDDATIVWRDGVIESAGSDIAVPFDAKVVDGGDSLHVYPGFIDGQAYWGSAERKRFDDTPQYRGEPSYERAGIRPERSAHEGIAMDADTYETAMKTGFTTAALGIRGYMIPGQLDLFLIHPELDVDDIYGEDIAMQMQFQASQGVFPSTVMGIIAQIRQLVSDAEAHREHQQYFASNARGIPSPDNNPTLEALYPVLDGDQRVFFQVNSKEMIERVFSLQDEHGFDVVLVSATEAYKVADEIADRNISVLASIDFPDKPEWKVKEEEGEEDDIELDEQDEQFREKQWDAYLERITNIKTLMDAGVDVGYASAEMELEKFSENFKTLVEYGELGNDDILGLLTDNTADILGFSETLGGLEEGQSAGFSVMNKSFTEDDVKVLYSVSEGELNEFND